MIPQSIDKEGTTIIFNQIHKQWIEPEIAKRLETGMLPDDFKIVECLVKLPKDRLPVVLFNDEIGWNAEAKRGDGHPFTPGEPVYLHEVAQIDNVELPEVDGVPVAFAHVIWNDFQYRISFDFKPNHPNFEASEYKENSQFGKTLAGHLQANLVKRAVHAYDGMPGQLKSIGLWAVPALLPYPLVQIAKQVQEGNTDGAQMTLIDFCSSDFLVSLANDWWNTEAFQRRQSLIEEAFFAHKEGKFHLSISTLLPHVEGVITDWEHGLHLGKGVIPFRIESKSKKFKDLALEIKPATFVYERVVESMSAFLIDGPVLASFTDWSAIIDVSFPGRHALSHGRYEDALYTKENSIKVFLLLDTIYRIISARDALA